MAKTKVQFLCRQCGSVHPKWMGKCPDCGTWDALEEYKAPTFDARAAAVAAPGNSMRGAVGAPAFGSTPGDLTTAGEALPLDQIDDHDLERLPTGIGEFDRILGGGIVPGSAVLVGGEPGIGKSTLLLQVARDLAGGRKDEGGRMKDEGKRAAKRPRAKADANEPADGDRTAAAVTAPDASAHPSSFLLHPSPPKVLYVTSEESARQTRMRAARLGIDSPNLLVLAETNVERILNQIHKVGPAVVIVDSIQMIYKPTLPAAPGSVTQLRECCMDLVYLAKSSGVALIFVGHVTKEGTLAGPKIIEHIVDTVVYFEGDRFHSHRIVRCVKNRFGSTHEVGLFEMTGEGLKEVTDPGNLFMETYGPGGPP
ncbi:MAG TPA: DNA repair protein RadA, partial [Tepidisphaeraceae bacterium]|nr:DNA repair protein RadA [Tepidisphaeraceae bacterium]